MIARLRSMKAEVRDLEVRLDEAADRNWEIREAQERTASLLEAQDDVIVRRGDDGAISYANDAYCALAGRSREDLLGSRLHLAGSGTRLSRRDVRWGARLRSKNHHA